MTDLVPQDRIEAIVGVERDRYDHWGKAVSADQRVYILHSVVCLRLHQDLRRCPLSRALDRGISLDDWVEDVPVKLQITDAGRLVPKPS